MAPKVKAPALDYDGPMDGSGKFFFPDGASYSGIAAFGIEALIWIPVERGRLLSGN